MNEKLQQALTNLRGAIEESGVVVTHASAKALLQKSVSNAESLAVICWSCPKPWPRKTRQFMDLGSA